MVGLLAAATPATAEIRERSMEVGGFLLYADFDQDSNIDDDVGIGGRFGIVFEENHELEFSFDFISTEDDQNLGLDVDLITARAGYVYNFLPRETISPLLTVGAGVQNVNISDSSLGPFGTIVDDTDPLVFGGVGVRFFLGDSFNIRLDGQIQAVFPDGSEDTFVDSLLMVGAGWILGGH